MDVEEVIIDLFTDDCDKEIDSLLENTYAKLLESDRSSDDSSDDEILMLIKERRTLSKVTNYIEDTVRLFDDIQFQQNFRLSRSTSHYLIDKIANANILSVYFCGRKKVTPEKALLMTMWYLGNTESFRQISDRFNVSRSCAYNVISKIIKYFVQNSKEYIKWPRNEEVEEIVSGFKAFQNIDGVLGAIDGSHIRIPKPQNHQHVYCNRKSYHSILLQVVVDHKKRFRDVFCGEAGSIHDVRMLKRSSFYSRCTTGLLLHGKFVLGDSAYPNLPWLIPPFKDNGSLTNQQKIFNYKHSATRIVVENALGLLKTRFRRLRFFENINIHFIVKAVIAACVLHNICINFDDLLIDVEDDPSLNENGLQCSYNEEAESVVDKRNEIFTSMFSQ